MDTSEALDRLDRNIRQLKIDFERFFNGASPTPPEDSRQGVFAEVKRLRDRRLVFADRFRLNTLEARLNSLSELFNRRLRDQELSGGPATGDRALLFEPQTSRDAVRALYNDLYEASGRRAATDLAGFHAFLKREAEKIRSRTGCRHVQFRLARDDGRIRLKARPLLKAAEPAAGGEES